MTLWLFAAGTRASVRIPLQECPMEEVWDLQALDLHRGPQRPPPHVQDIRSGETPAKLGPREPSASPAGAFPLSSITDGVRWG